LCVSRYVIVKVLVVFYCQRRQNEGKEGAVLHNDSIFYVGVDVLSIGVIQESNYSASRID